MQQFQLGLALRPERFIYLDQKLGMYEFLPIIDRNPDIPDTLYLFKTSKFFDNLNDELE
jgi:hypothetical protein